LALAIGATAGLLLVLPLVLLRGNEPRDSGFSDPGTSTTAVTEPPSDTLTSPAEIATTGTMSIRTDVTLTKDHVGTIRIDGGRITLDCGGFSVIGPGTGSGTGIEIWGRTGVTIRNCHVTGFDFGILLRESDDNTIIDNTVVDSTAGFAIEDSSSNTLVNNTASNSSWFGYVLSTGSSDNTLIGNGSVNTGDTGAGFNLHDAHSNTLEANTSFGGDFILDGSNRNVLSDNTSTGNLGRVDLSETDGFLLLGSSYNTLDRNRAVDAGNVGFRIDEASNENKLTSNTAERSGNAGFEIKASWANELSDNTASGAGTAGYKVWADASDNSLDRNSADLNPTGFWDVSGGVGTSGTANQYTRNTCTGNTTASDPDDLCSE
jgi:parallel beta-helix repeat protein